jgi:hypothetical protein
MNQHGIASAEALEQRSDVVTARWNGAKSALTSDENKRALAALTADGNAENMKRALTALTSDEDNSTNVKRPLGALAADDNKRALTTQQDKG